MGVTSASAASASAPSASATMDSTIARESEMGAASVSGSGTSSEGGRGGVPDDPEVETVIQPALEPDDE